MFFPNFLIVYGRGADSVPVTLSQAEAEVQNTKLYFTVYNLDSYTMFIPP